MFANSLNTIVLALAAFNAAGVLANTEPAVTQAPAKREELEARQCRSCSSLERVTKDGQMPSRNPAIL